MTNAERYILDFVTRGFARVDTERGEIWRLHVLTRSGRVIEVAPRRMERRKADGYLLVAIGRSTVAAAHRIIWLAGHGQISDDMEINHINGRRDDNRIANLELVTPKQNMRHAFDVLHRTVLLGKDNGRAVLTEDQVLTIRATAGRTKELAELFGVSPKTIKSVRAGKSWKHLEVPHV